MRVVYFAGAAAAAGLREEFWETRDPISEGEFWDWAVARHPALGALRHACRLARNQVYLEPGESLHPEDEVAVLPPVSGG